MFMKHEGKIIIANMLSSYIMISLQPFLFPSFWLIILMILVGFKWISFHSSNTKKRFPPSPRKLPIIGNLHQVGSIPHQSFEALSRKHGPIMLLHLGSVPTLVASSAGAAREIMKTHDLSFSSRPNLSIHNILLYGSRDISFSPYGEYWRQLKSLTVLNLLSNTRVKSFRRVREEEMSVVMGVLVESCGSLVNLSELIMSYTNNVICRVALGRTYDGLESTHLMRQLMDALGVFSIGSYIPWLWWVDRLVGFEGKARNIAKEFDEFFERILEEHEKKKTRTSDEGQDFVDILLDIQRHNATGFTLERDSLKAVILDVFGGGIDTTFTTIEWAISRLIKHPRVMKKLQQELTEIAQGRSMILEEDLEKMEYLKAVIKETLRLHGPLPLLVPHQSTQDVKLMGYDIPAGTQVLINAWAIGRDSAQWKEPLEFNPERFLNNSIDYKGVHFEWLPFGAGRRGCPGIQFGVANVELALANIVYKFDFALPNGVRNEDLDMSETYGIVVHKKSSLLVTVSAWV